jgi:hypothetical protein
VQTDKEERRRGMMLEFYMWVAFFAMGLIVCLYCAFNIYRMWKDLRDIGKEKDEEKKGGEE